jgi:hypothetical protein
LRIQFFYRESAEACMRGYFPIETEHKTVRDTTTGRPKPMGARGATMADTVGAKQD